MTKQLRFQHTLFSVKAIQYYASRWSEDDDFDMGWYDEDYERLERYDMMYEEMLTKYNDDPEKMHKAWIKTKRYWKCQSFVVVPGWFVQNAIRSIPLPNELLTAIESYMYPYKLNHVQFKDSLFHYRMNRDRTLDRSILKYMRKSSLIAQLESNIYNNPYETFHEELERHLTQKVNYMINKKTQKTEYGCVEEVIDGPLRRFDHWLNDNTKVMWSD